MNDPTGVDISLETLQKARELYSVLMQHKSIFIQVHVLTHRSKHYYNILR